MIAFDTNVLVYCYDRSDPQRQEIALELIASTRNGLLLWQVACEFIAASRKLSVHGFTAEHAWKRLNELTAVLPLAEPTPVVLMTAKDLHLKGRWSFWDAMIVAGCLDRGVTRLYSEDLPGNHAPDGLEIVNPFA